MPKIYKNLWGRSTNVGSSRTAFDQEVIRSLRRVNRDDNVSVLDRLSSSSGLHAIGGASITHGLTLPNITVNNQGSIKANSVETYSSARYKESVRELTGSLDLVDSLRGVRYVWKDSGKEDIGFIAEQVGQVIPEIVTFEDNGVDVASMNYSRITCVLVEAVKELLVQINELKQQLDNIKK